MAIEYDRAIANYSGTIQRQPHSADAFRVRGRAYYMKGDYQRALADFTNVIALEPDNPSTYTFRALLYRALGDEVNAALDEDKAQALNRRPSAGPAAAAEFLIRGD